MRDTPLPASVTEPHVGKNEPLAQKVTSLGLPPSQNPTVPEGVAPTLPATHAVNRTLRPKTAGLLFEATTVVFGGSAGGPIIRASEHVACKFDVSVKLTVNATEVFAAASGGNQEKLDANGLATLVPSVGLNVDPDGAPVAVNFRLEPL